MSEQEEDFAAMFEASVKAQRFERGQTIQGTSPAIGPKVAFVSIGGKGEAADRPRGAEGRRRRHRGLGRRPHRGDGGLDRRRHRAVAQGRPQRRHAARARGRVPSRALRRRQGREGGQGRLRSPHRPRARVLPALPDRHRPHRGSGGARGKAYAFRIIEYKDGGKDLVVSRRQQLEDEQQAKAAELRKSIVPGAVLTGRVASVRDFGAFIDLGGGIQGLLHVSEMSWSRARQTRRDRRASATRSPSRCCASTRPRRRSRSA